MRRGWASFRLDRGAHAGSHATRGQIASAPFYAIATHAGTVVGFAGPTVDSELRVLDQAGAPLPGLYAGGEVIGVGALMGDGYGGGMCVTPAMSLGRILGRQLSDVALATR